MRNEKPLYPIPGNDGELAAAVTQSVDLTPSQQSGVEHVLALFSVDQDYSIHFPAMHQKYVDNGNTWLTDDIEELGRLYASIQEKEKALPMKLIQLTG